MSPTARAARLAARQAKKDASEAVTSPNTTVMDDSTINMTSSKKRKADDEPESTSSYAAGRSTKMQKTSNTEDVTSKELAQTQQKVFPKPKANIGRTARRASRNNRTQSSAGKQKTSDLEKAIVKQKTVQQSSAKKRKRDEAPDTNSDSAVNSAVKRVKMDGEQSSVEVSKYNPAGLSTPATAGKANLAELNEKRTKAAADAAASKIPAQKNSAGKARTSKNVRSKASAPEKTSVPETSAPKTSAPVTAGVSAGPKEASVIRITAAPAPKHGKAPSGQTSKASTSNVAPQSASRTQLNGNNKVELTEKQKQVMEDYRAEQLRKARLPDGYKHNKLVAHDIDDFCMMKGLGSFGDLTLDQQQRLVREMTMRRKYLNTLDLQRTARTELSREKNLLNKAIQRGDSSGQSTQGNKVTVCEKQLEEAIKEAHNWAKYDGHQAYINAYNSEKNKDDFRGGNTTQEDVNDRVHEFFAKPLPVEIWREQKRRDRELSDLQTTLRPQVDEERLKKNKLGMSSSNDTVSDDCETDDEDIEKLRTSGPVGGEFSKVDAKAALETLVKHHDIDVVRIGKDEDGGFDLNAYDDKGNRICPCEDDESGEELFEMCCAWMLRKLECLAGIPCGSLEGAKEAMLDTFEKHAGLEKAKAKIAQVYELESTIDPVDIVEHAINELPDWIVTKDLLDAMLEYHKKSGGESVLPASNDE